MRTSLDTLLEQSVELVELGSNRKVDSVAGKVNDETTLDGGANLLNDAERLAVTLGGNLRTLECRLDARDHRLVQRSGRGNGDLDLTTVCGHEFLEARDDLFGLTETSVLGKDGEEVAVRVQQSGRE